MTNYENIQSMPVEKFAELLLKKIPRPVSPFPVEDNENKSEEWKFSEKQELYETSDHRFFKTIDEAIKHEIEWLYAEKARDIVYD